MTENVEIPGLLTVLNAESFPNPQEWDYAVYWYSTNSIYLIKRVLTGIKILKSDVNIFCERGQKFYFDNYWHALAFYTRAVAKLVDSKQLEHA